MSLVHSKSLSLLLFLILYTLADDSTPLGPPFQDPSSSAISFPHDVDDSNGLELSGWTTTVDSGNTGDDLVDQQDVFLPAAADQTMVACAGPAPSQDGSPPNLGKRRSRQLRKRDPPGICVPPDYLKDDTAPPSSSGGTTTNKRPGRPPGKTIPKAKPIQIPKNLPLLGDPDSPLCNQYFPGLGANYAVCYYPYFKTIPRSPLVHMLSPCRACESLIFRQTSFPKGRALMGEMLSRGGLETHAQAARAPQTPHPPKPSVVRDMN